MAIDQAERAQRQAERAMEERLNELRRRQDETLLMHGIVLLCTPPR
jgi:hypothetical protein